MRFETKIIALGAACFLLFTIANFPARAAFRLFAPDSVSAFGVSGTLWNGSAKIINAGGQQLRNTEWDLALSQLLVARLGADLKTRWNGGFLEGFGAISAFGTVVLSESDASLNLGALGSMLKGPPIDGQVSVRIEQLELQDRWPVELIASAELRNLSSSFFNTFISKESCSRTLSVSLMSLIFCCKTSERLVLKSCMVFSWLFIFVMSRITIITS